LCVVGYLVRQRVRIPRLSYGAVVPS
jgi:hypothetical protein